MQGDPDFARELVKASRAYPADIGLRLLHARILRRAGDLRGAARGLHELLGENGSNVEARAELAATLHEGGQLAEAENQALIAATASPGDPRIIDTLVVVLLSRGRADEALKFIQPQRQRSPHEQTWIAYEATAYRLSGHAAYRELYDYDRLVRV
jgi:Flp pilus assembly protein TadD